MSHRTAPKRRCAICYETGHYQYVCKTLKTGYGQFPIPKNNSNSRNAIAKILVVTDPMSKCPLIVRHSGDKRPIIYEMQKKVKALIIHQRYYVSTSMDNVNLSMSLSDNICVECTIIEENYNVGPKKLYDPALIMRYIKKTQSNIVVNLL